MINIPKITFVYDIEKDIDNIIIGIETVRNGRNPDRIIKEIINKYGESPSRDNIKSFLENIWKDKSYIREMSIKQLQEYWDKINDIYFERLADFMEIKEYEKESLKIPGYFSSRHGSGYNVPNLWFAVSLYSGTMQNVITAMHEIMHLFFHKYWWNECKKYGLDNKNIWDVKEAVTVLLNIWYKDIITELDWGYMEHTDLRRLIIKKWWPGKNNFSEIVKLSCEYMKENKEKSPTWIK